jgi:hypothetical protein
VAVDPLLIAAGEDVSVVTTFFGRGEDDGAHPSFLQPDMIPVPGPGPVCAGIGIRFPPRFIRRVISCPLHAAHPLPHLQISLFEPSPVKASLGAHYHGFKKRREVQQAAQNRKHAKRSSKIRPIFIFIYFTFIYFEFFYGMGLTR